MCAHTRVALSETKPIQSRAAQHLARELLFKIQMGREHFIATCEDGLIASVGNLLKDSGAELVQPDGQCWTPENHYLQGVRGTQSINALIRINSVIVRLRLQRTRGLAFNNEDDNAKHETQLYLNESLRGARSTTSRLDRKRGRIRAPIRRRGVSSFTAVMGRQMGAWQHNERQYRLRVGSGLSRSIWPR